MKSFLSDKSGAGLVFSTDNYPRFGRSLYKEQSPPAPVSNSPFFWWFKFLQLNDYYANCVAGVADGCADIASDFGDVRAVDFKTFWKNKAKYFAEEKTGYEMRVAYKRAELAPFTSDQAVNLVLPLNWRRRALIKKFGKILNELLSDSRLNQQASRPVHSTAKYRLARWNIYALETAYRVYTLKRDNQQLAWADVALRAKLNVEGIEGMQEGDKRPTYVDVRRRATTLAMRYNGYAKGYIKAAASTRFPR